MNHVVKIWRFFLDFSQILAIENLKKKNTQNWILALSILILAFWLSRYPSLAPYL